MEESQDKDKRLIKLRTPKRDECSNVRLTTDLVSHARQIACEANLLENFT